MGQSGFAGSQSPTTLYQAQLSSSACLCRFIRALSGALGTLTQLLASATLSDVTETIQLLICYDKFCIHGAGAVLRQMLPLVFSKEQGEGHPRSCPAKPRKRD